ncbi:MAG: hypothetical protein AB1449_02445 [Chloroflexota bacterium]
MILVVLAAMNVLGRPLQSSTSPQGIVSFELSGDIVRSRAMVEGWGEAGRLAAGLSLGLDYLVFVLIAGPAARWTSRRRLR